MHAGLVLEPGQQVVGGVALEEAGEVVAVVERVHRVEDRDRLVDGPQGRGALDVHVDVARDHRRDPVGVGAELAGREDLDGEPDVGVGDLVGDHLRTAAMLGLGLGIAVRELEGHLTAGLLAALAVLAAVVAAARRQGQQQCDDTLRRAQLPLRVRLGW